MARFIARRVGRLCRLHPLEPADVERGLGLFELHPQLDARDAVFAAVALNREIELILSTDRGFEEVDDLHRVDPADREGVDSLLVDPPRSS